MHGLIKSNLIYKNKHKLIMADTKQTNWADDEDYDSEEGEEGFGLDSNAKSVAKPTEQIE